MPAVHYLHHSYPREEMAALYLAGDVMLVTPLRDGMNLVAKEYVACRHDDGGAAGALRVHRCGRGPAPGVPVQPARHLRPQGRDPGRPAGRPARCPAADAGDAPAGVPARRAALGAGLPRSPGHVIAGRTSTRRPASLLARPRVLVGLDFDGVLAPIVEHRDEARPVAGGHRRRTPAGRPPGGRGRPGLRPGAGQPASRSAASARRRPGDAGRQSRRREPAPPVLASASRQVQGPPAR